MDETIDVVWADPAVDDLDAIAEWIALENEAAAVALVARVLENAERLARFPDSGRWVPELETKTYRELIVPPCRVMYRREDSRVIVLHVRRSEQHFRAEDLLNDEE